MGLTLACKFGYGNLNCV